MTTKSRSAIWVHLGGKQPKISKDAKTNLTLKTKITWFCFHLKPSVLMNSSTYGLIAFDFKRFAKWPRHIALQSLHNTHEKQAAIGKKTSKNSRNNHLYETNSVGLLWYMHLSQLNALSWAISIIIKKKIFGNGAFQIYNSNYLRYLYSACLKLVQS